MKESLTCVAFKKQHTNYALGFLKQNPPVLENMVWLKTPIILRQIYAT